MTTKYIFKCLLDIISEDSDLSDPFSIISIVGSTAFTRDEFIQVSDPRTEVTGITPRITYQGKVVEVKGDKGVIDFAVAVQSTLETQCTDMASRIDFLFTDPYLSESTRDKPIPEKGIIGSIIKSGEEPVFIPEREIYEIILLYKLLYVRG